MRYSGPIIYASAGDSHTAAEYLPVARALLGQLINQAELSRDPQRFSARDVTLNDGTVISVRAVGDVVREVFIDARLSTGIVLDVLQYMFTLRGAGVTPAPTITLDNGLNFVQSAWACVFVIFRAEAEPEFLYFPLVSTRSDIQPSLDDSWPYVALTAANIGTELASVLDQLPVRRYEVSHAESTHIEQPDKLSLVHAPWMQGGLAPYNAFAYTKATQLLVGVGSGMTQTRNSPNSVTTTQVEDWAYTNSFKPTDVTYETALDIYERPEASAGTPVSGGNRGGAPDMDWYTSYSRAVITSEFGTREYGIAIDANQKLYVWPVAADGTGDASGSSYEDQNIKTSVDAQYVLEHQLVFPSGVYVGDVSHRDNDGLSSFEDNVLGFDSSRYVWTPDSTGLRFATLGVKYQGMTVAGLDLYWGEYGYFDPSAPPEPPSDKRTYRTPETVVLDFELQITMTGAGLDEFEISVGQPTEITTDNNFYPTQAGFAGENSFGGATKDDLLVAGIRGYYLSPVVPGFTVSAADRKREFSAVAGAQYRHFVPFSSGFILSGSQYFSVSEQRGRFNAQGAPQDSDPVVAALGKYIHDISMEATLNILNVSAANSDLYSVCIRKALFTYYEDFEPPDYFTAEVAGIDFLTGTVALIAQISVQDPQLKVFREAGEAPQRDPWLSTDITCTYAKGFFIFRGGATLYEWFQDPTIATHFAHTPAGVAIDKRRTETTFIQDTGAWDYFLGDFLVEIIDLFGSGNTYTVPGYPLGMETYAALHSRHMALGLPHGSLMANEDVVSFTGNLICFEGGTLTTNAATNQLSGVNGVFNKELDVLIVGNTVATHKEAWEAAFGRTVNTEMVLRLESEHVDTWMGTGSSAGVDIDLYRNHIIVEKDGGVDVFKINIDQAWGWMYPGLRKSPTDGWGLFPQQLNNPDEDGRIQREQQTLLDPTFSGRAYGYTR